MMNTLNPRERGAVLAITAEGATPAAVARTRKRYPARSDDENTTAGEREARECIRLRLSTASEPVLMADLAYEAERAAYAKRKSPLCGSLDGYAELLPDGWRTEWMNRSGSCWEGALLYAVRQGQEGGLKATVPVPGLFDAAVDMGPQGVRA
jgi:hypothetical protein